MMASSASVVAIRRAYRDLAHIIKQMPEKDRGKSWLELRESFRKPVAAGKGSEEEQLEARLKIAHDRISFLRISTVKLKPRGQSGRWVYKDGERLTSVDGTIRNSKGRVVSNWDGNNLDPDSTKRHRQQLTRAGFVNNSHAKGIF
jgi:hypothetical protein